MTFTFTSWGPKAYASPFDETCISIRFPLIAPPVSPATATPQPSTHTSEPNGITPGSTATTFLFGLAFKSIPVADTPEQPLQFAVYAVAFMDISLLSASLLLELSDLSSFDLLADEAFSSDSYESSDLDGLSDDDATSSCSSWACSFSGSFVPTATTWFSASS